MAATVYIDSLETLTMKEKWGTIVEVTRLAIVRGLSGTDYSVMYDALTAAGIPPHNSFFTDPHFSHLHLVDRDVKMTDVDTAEVTLVFGMYNDQGQWLGGADPGSPVWQNYAASGKTSCSVEQKKTNLYRDGGTGAESLIVLSHTYAGDDPDYAGRTIPQTGEVDVYIPQRTLVLEGQKYGSPYTMANFLIGGINNGFWRGASPHTWMCTEIAWEYRRTPYFFVTFTFQHNPDTWNPTAVFIDDRTSRPPQGLVPGVGYKYVRYHREIDFDSALQVIVLA